MITVALQAVIGFTFIVHLATIGLVFWRCLSRAQRLAPATDTPHICLLRPVCGLTDLERHTLRSSFDLDYPDYQIIFAPRARPTPPCHS